MGLIGDMTPHLHPRSRMTSSLFGTTLLVSFLVVSMPHIIPCPAPRGMLADSEGRKRAGTRQRKGCNADAEGDQCAGESTSKSSGSCPAQVPAPRTGHECPVPKPTGAIGRFLGFEETSSRPKQVRPSIEVKEEKEILNR